MDYEKLIDSLNKRKNIELNRLKQRGNKDVKDIEYRINKNQPTRTRLNCTGIDHYSSTRPTEFKEENIQKKITPFLVRFKNL